MAGGGGQREATNDRRRFVAAPMARRVTRLGSVCNGALILAAAGLLKGRRATTHWAFLRELRKTVGTGVCDDAIYTRDGNLYTSAGVTAGMDMALAMLEEDHGGRGGARGGARARAVPEAAPGASRSSVTISRRSSARTRACASCSCGCSDTSIEDLSVPRLAERVAMSARNFARHFADSVGVAPGHYVRQIRVTAARRKLEQTDRALQQVARRCGFGTPESLRRGFIAALGVTPGAYRERFRAR